MEFIIHSPKYGKKIVFIDKQDLHLIKSYHPYIHHIGHFFYVRLNPTKIHLHRLIMDPPKGMVIDHINRNPLDNRRKNLRICTIQENLRNQIRPNNKTGVAVVAIFKRYGYTAQIKVNYKKIHLGVFKTIEEATKARKAAERRYYAKTF